MTTGTQNPLLLRIMPSVAVGIGLWMLYSALGFGIQWRSGIPYTDWFKTAENAWRTAVIPLAVGSAVLLVFVLGTRWRYLWSDPFRLQTTRVMKVAMVFWCIAIAVRLVGIRWSEVPPDLLLAILTSGILVGFAEEILFRGIFLRSMREGGRPEAAAAIWTAVCFGLFHLPNMFLGTGLIGMLQAVMAALSGSILYAFRRHYGVIWPAMVAHGAWDISTFLAGGFGVPWLALTSVLMQLIFVALGIAVFASIIRTDRQTIAIPVAAR